MQTRFALRMSGPLAPCAPEFERETANRGYTDLSAAELLRLMAHLSLWLERNGLEPAELTPMRVEEYLEDRRSEHTKRLKVSSLRPMLEVLRSMGVVPLCPDIQVSPSADDELLERYRAHLAEERGLVEEVVKRFTRTASLFLADHPGLEPTVEAADVTAFCARVLPTQGRAVASNTAAGLRSFLRFLHLTGLVDAPLAQAVPRVASTRDKGLPRFVTSETVRRLVQSCDRRSRRGRRDFAIVMLLSRLGLRAGEVAGLQLDDIDWRSGVIVVKGKGNRRAELPLPDDVGAAVAGYLRRGRPKAATRTVFLRAIAPNEGLSPGGVTWVVYDACARAGVPRISAHWLRHSCATGMLRRGANLVEVGQVLRQSRVGTTSIREGRLRVARSPGASMAGW